MLTRRTTLALPATLLAAPALAQSDWPTRPVRIVVPFAAGGSTDVSTRLLAPRIQQILGQSVVIENRGGAGGTIGSDSVARAPKDGSVFLMGTISTHVLAVGLYGDRLPYDPERDFIAVAPTVMVPICTTVHPALGVADLAGLIALLKANPGKYAYGTGGAGGSAHIGAVAFLNAIGAEATHVPYRGSAPMLTDMLAGQVNICFDTPALIAPHHAAGRLRCLAVATAARSPLMPAVPTAAEAGLPGYKAYSWFGLFAPAGTPEAIVARMNAAVRQALLEPATATRLREQDLPPIAEGSPAEFAAFLKRELAEWVPVVRASGATAN
ncbi:Bug family tripartite tricarboxylate transporter substrate binding protein [Falsiroseomonas selenitidurans]|uniref:Tripartite tricarboxylate transporter substrate binding protein n=1 Tax=Falsiroseomonas selenitidurans TaxID=2716335 RepID=A0ABX1E6I5_9PROT|nr:tripartite tricarboxylate transporter substrate binding protein [Falsiroseomonas selenitidurans]NKC32794.1 tripartite tricarboxylate transporter substrate binding protein [Falsiroseomonas selenitidurans]